MNLEEEVRDGYLVTKEMKRIWAVELNLLKELLRVCKKHNLRIWVDAGTLIGAVRHQGFIPWDDDIDTVMPRDDYEKLCQLAPDEFKDPMFFQNINTDRWYWTRHSQLRDKSTSMLPVGGKPRKCNNGIFIDIFVLDSIPNSAKNVYKMIRSVKWAKLRLKIAISLMRHCSLWLYDKLQWDRKYFAKYERAIKKFRNPDNRFLGKISLHEREYLFNAEAFSDTVELEFEDMTVPAPVGWNHVLTVNYGDYMIPKQMPTGHGKFVYDTSRAECLKTVE